MLPAATELDITDLDCRKLENKKMSKHRWVTSMMVKKKSDS